MIFYAGDTHGRVPEIEIIDQQAIAEGVEYVIQVGDFGCHWTADCGVHEYFVNRSKRAHGSQLKNPIWITCGGNHDNWDRWEELAIQQGNPDLVELAPDCFWAQRGTSHIIEGKKYLFFGGTESIDRHLRIEGYSWWRKETPSYQEFLKFSDQLESEKPDIVVAHDSPARCLMRAYIRTDSTTPRNLENIVKLSNYTVPLWYFGHHHVTQTWDILGTKYICCGFNGGFVRG